MEEETKTIEQEEDEFEAGFNESVAEEKSSADNEEKSDNPEAGEEGQDDKQDGAGEEEGGQSAGEQEAGSGEQEPPKEEPEFDYKGEYEKLKHQYDSAQGRVLAAQRVLDEHAEFKKRQQQQAAQPSKQEVAEAVQTPEKWEAFKKEYPEVAEAMDAHVGSMNQSLRNEIFEEVNQQYQPALQALVGKAQQQQVRDELDALSKYHSDWKDVAASPEFSQWVQTQPSSTQWIVREGKSAADVAAVLDHYKLHKKVADQERLIEERQQQEQQRSKRLEMATTVTPKTGGAPASQVAKDDFDGGWDAAFNGSH